MRILKNQTEPARFRKNLDDPLPKMTAPGTLHLDWTICGKSNCRCARGLLHGPYIYRRWRHHGQQRKAYVPMRDLARVLAEMARQRAMVPRPSRMKRMLKELRDAQ